MNLEKELRRLSAVTPSSAFRRNAKNRLMHRIQTEPDESWFRKWIRPLKPVEPSPEWLKLSRVRLMNRLSAPERVIGLLAWTKRVVASALVMLLAVTTVSLSIGSKQTVVAAEDTYLEVLSGYAEVKQADRLDWEKVTEKTTLSVGDLIRLGDTSQAVIHFFDDSQLRMSENSALLISRMESSAGFTQQGIIETALHKGRVWVQTLNVDDEFAGFSVITREAIVSTSNGSFDVTTNLFEDTTIRVFKRQVKVQALSEQTREVIAQGRLNTAEVLNLSSENNHQKVDQLADLASAVSLTEEARQEHWVTDNLKKDSQHLADLRDREWIRMQAAAGYLPGDFLYPVKRAKERLSLALSFDESAATSAVINMANQRLGEAILLIQQGKTDEAKAALAEYQKGVEKIASAKNNPVARRQLSHQVVASHQKSLMATLPGDAKINLVKQALDKTEELLAEDPVERANVRLRNALDNLAHVQEYVASGDLSAAQDTLVSHDVTVFDVLEAAETLEDVEAKKALYNQVLETQYAQQRLLNEIEASIDENADEVLRKLVQNTNEKLLAGIESTVEVVKPVLPDVVLAATTALPEDDKVREFVEKVNIYRTRRGQMNQISRLLKENPGQARDLEFLTNVRSYLDGQARELVEFEIEQLRTDLAAQKSRKVKAKIDRSKRLLRD